MNTLAHRTQKYRGPLSGHFFTTTKNSILTPDFFLDEDYTLDEDYCNIKRKHQDRNLHDEF